MKIFNWVHKRLHQRVLNDGLAENVDRAELETKDQDAQAFLKEVGLVNVEGLDGWSDGILTIGTFGFDPLKPFNPQNEYVVLESEEEEESHEINGNEDNGQADHDDQHYGDNVEDEELNPLMFTTFGHSFDQDIGPKSDATVEKPAGDHHVILTIDGVHLTPFKGSNEITSCAEPDERNKRGQRVTLADLFQADVHGDDHVGQLKVDSCNVQPEVMQKKMKVRTKSGGLAFAKKLIPHGKEDSSPIKNLQKLMKRMLKRKIHPAEVDPKVGKSDGQNQLPSAVELVTGVENDVSESVSLLPIQGATCAH